VEDILATGATARLPTALPASGPYAPFSDADVPEPPFQGRRGPDITLDDLRAAIDEGAGFFFATPIV
jgi:hypothetical protein